MLVLENKRIFLVEDDVNNRAIAQLLLEQQGAMVAFERWGIATIQRLQKFMPVDAILMDLNLPNGITGYDVFTTIRSHPEFEAIPIIAVSASNPTEAVPRTKAMGFSGFIGKPVRFDVFPRQVAEILEGKPVWQVV
ncbi:MAG: response regulator [Anaerolineales bacterium]|nr:response regulator [Anaerolineales bacterium]